MIKIETHLRICATRTLVWSWEIYDAVGVHGDVWFIVFYFPPLLTPSRLRFNLSLRRRPNNTLFFFRTRFELVPSTHTHTHPHPHTYLYSFSFFFIHVFHPMFFFSFLFPSTLPRSSVSSYSPSFCSVHSSLMKNPPDCIPPARLSPSPAPSYHRHADKASHRTWKNEKKKSLLCCLLLFSRLFRYYHGECDMHTALQGVCVRKWGEPIEFAIFPTITP